MRDKEKEIISDVFDQVGITVKDSEDSGSSGTDSKNPEQDDLDLSGDD